MSIDPRVCPACGERDEVPRCSPEGEPARLRCSVCGDERAFLRLPLFCLTGPSGGGKSTVARALGPLVADRVVTLEQDVLWSAEMAETPGGVRRFRATWLRLAAMIGQSGRPVLLCGTVVPEELEPLPERALFSEIHYLGLLCEPGVLVRRLRARPAWRGWDEGRIAEMVEFAAELAADAADRQPPITMLDTTGVPLAVTVEAASSWLLAHLDPPGRPAGP